MVACKAHFKQKERYFTTSSSLRVCEANTFPVGKETTRVATPSADSDAVGSLHEPPTTLNINANALAARVTCKAQRTASQSELALLPCYRPRSAWDCPEQHSSDIKQKHKTDRRCHRNVQYIEAHYKIYSLNVFLQTE